MKCLFCEREANSEEHILPLWVTHAIGHSAFKDKDRYIYGYTYSNVPPFKKTKRKYWHNFVINSVCKGCNNGWMHELEVKAGKILQKDIASMNQIDLVLTDLERDDLAHWAWMKALCLATLLPSNNPFEYLPVELYKLCKNGVFPSGIIIEISNLPSLKSGFVVGGKLHIINTYGDIGDSEDIFLNLIFKRVTLKMGRFLFRISLLPNFVPYRRVQVVIKEHSPAFDALLVNNTILSRYELPQGGIVKLSGLYELNFINNNLILMNLG